ncbi:MAG: septal ring lytic transglycosylase RlpA family protein [Balneolaceae bacterium]
MSDHQFPAAATWLAAGLFLFLNSCGIALQGVETREYRPGSVLEQGVASWYGPNFHGRATANGETYDMEALTAAHRTLPFNTLVRVVNQGNSREVHVRINDRGPYVGNRIIDLSRRAAREIDMIGSGTAEVTLYLLEEGDRPITSVTASSQETFTIQIASFDTAELAARVANTIDGARVEEVPLGGQSVYRVYYGHYSDTESAYEEMRQLEQRGISGFVKQADN